MTAQVMNVRRPPHDQGFALGTERCGCLGKHAGQGGHILEAHRCQWLSTPHINQRSGGGDTGLRNHGRKFTQPLTQTRRGISVSPSPQHHNDLSVPFLGRGSQWPCLLLSPPHPGSPRVPKF